MNFDAVLEYTLLYFFIFICGFCYEHSVQSPANKKIFLIITIGLLAIMVMFRGLTVGNDTDDYAMIFKEVSRANNPMDYISHTSMESGYILLNWILSRISTNPRILFITTGGFLFYSIGHFLYKYAKCPDISICLFVATMKLNSYGSGIRQAISIGILLFAFKYMMERKPIKYFLLVLLAFFFHKSSLIAVVLYFIISIRETNLQQEEEKAGSNNLLFSFFMFLAIVIGLLGFGRLFTILLNMFPKYSYYLGDSYFDGVPRLAVILRIIIYTLFLIIPKFLVKNEIESEDANNNFAFRRINAVSVGILIMALQANIFTRIGDLTYFYSDTGYANNIYYMTHNNKIVMRILTYLLFYLYGLVIIIYRTPAWQSFFPYHFGF